jgi:hypothetical protein
MLLRASRLKKARFERQWKQQPIPALFGYLPFADDSRVDSADVDKIMNYIALSEPFASAALPPDPFTIMALETTCTSPESRRLLIC